MKAFDYAFLDWVGPAAIAHRASSSAMPDNVMSSIEAVMQIGYQYIETDIRTTRDGVPLLFHDAKLGNGHTRLRDTSLSELRNIPGGESIPRLEDVLIRWPGLRINIDLKDRASIGAVAGVIKKLDAFDRVCVTSFFDCRIAKIRKVAGPSLCTGTGTAASTLIKTMSLIPSTLRPPLRGVHGAVLQIPITIRGRKIVTPKIVDYAHQIGLKVHVWTVNNVSEMESMLNIGVDGIVTDELLLLKELFEAKRLWRS